MQLLGVMMVSTQQGLGETSMLSLTTRYGNLSLSLWSSGTGAAGLLGFLYVYLLNTTLGVSSRHVLLFSAFITVPYYYCFSNFNIPPPPDQSKGRSDSVSSLSPSPLNCKERLRMTLGLWKIGIPLIVVYFAEYAMQSGTWAAIGFPLEDCEARKKFYQYAGFCYQLGVFIR